MPRPTTDPLDHAAALHDRAASLLVEGMFDRARPPAARALALFARHSGRHHPDVASALDTLAMIDAGRGDRASALRLLRRALAILARYPRHPEVRPFAVQSLSNLGAVLRDAGRYADARPVLLRAVRLARSACGASSVGYAAALNEYGMLCKFAGWFSAGMRAYRRALDLAEAAGDARDLEAAVLHNLGGIEHARDRFAEAEGYARRGLALRTSMHGDGHPEALLDAGALAAILADLGRHAEAEAHYRRILPRIEALHGARHHEVAVVCHNLAAVLAATGRPDEADALYRRALAIKRARLGASHPDLALTLHNLAALCGARGRRAEGARLHRRAHAVALRSLGAEHPTTRACREALG